MILVIGATSFIGPAVVEKLLFAGNDIRCLIRTDSDTSGLEEVSKKTGRPLGFATGNLNSSDSILYSFKGIDTVVYLVDLKRTTFVKNLLNALLKTTIRRAIFISSTTVLVPLKNIQKDLKAESEQMIESSGLDYTILRPTMIYGNEKDRNYSKMIGFIRKRGFFVIFGNGEHLIQPIYITDVAEAVVSCMGNKKTVKKTYEICGEKSIKYRDMLEIVKLKMEKQFKIIRLPVKASKFAISIYNKIFPASALRPDMIERMEIDKAYSYDEAKNDFGFSPIGFEEGIGNLIYCLQNNNQDKKKPDHKKQYK